MHYLSAFVLFTFLLLSSALANEKSPSLVSVPGLPGFVCTKLADIDKVDINIDGIRINNITARETTFLNQKFKTFEISYSAVNRSSASIYISGEFILTGENGFSLVISADELFSAIASQSSQIITGSVITDPSLSEAPNICMRFKVQPR